MTKVNQTFGDMQLAAKRARFYKFQINFFYTCTYKKHSFLISLEASISTFRNLNSSLFQLIFVQITDVEDSLNLTRIIIIFLQSLHFYANKGLPSTHLASFRVRVPLSQFRVPCRCRQVLNLLWCAGFPHFRLAFTDFSSERNDSVY